MSRTKRKTAKREFEINPLTRHTTNRRCDLCECWYPIDDIVEDAAGTWCLSCDAGRADEWLTPEDD